MVLEGPAGPFTARAESAKSPLADFPAAPQNRNHNLLEVDNDDDLARVLKQSKAARRPVVLSYGASWCHACHKMLPTFFNLSNEYAKPLFVYADVDKCSKLGETVRYTPTFQFYRDGDKVDEFYGAGVQRLRDRVWLQS